MALFHLDTNWLIAMTEFYHEHHDAADTAIKKWLSEGHQIATSTVAWNEFLIGKKRPQSIDDAMRCQAVINGGIVTFGLPQAEKAAELFNHIGRKRRLQRDCLIAADAIVAGAELATFNVSDFRSFVPFGLTIASFTALESDTADERPAEGNVFAYKGRRRRLT